MAADVLKRAAEGALGGLAGTAVIQGLTIANKYVAPEMEPPEAEDPASFMLWQGEKHLPRETWMKVPASVETVAGFGLSFAYGATFGAVYGALRGESGAKLSTTMLDGAVVGLGVWAVGYLGWLPAAGLIPPVTKREVKQEIGPVVEHLAYGVATVAVCRWMMKKMS
ncbi:MAG: hypothetical protein ACTHN5_10125 [Phycisphaerae bacterium]